MDTEKRVPNRLINETSPYLLQHAYNPVYWYPWCDEAFEKARTEDKPVFLSIGYSTCHWCHVMEEESFEDRQVAEYLNSHFVSVKVDKEERPDIDEVYMTVCQALTGSGGWPTTILMTPAQKPFFAGTYLPKKRRYGHTGLMELLAVVKEKWTTERDALSESGDKITAALNQTEQQEFDGGTVDKYAVERAVKQLSQSFDKAYGGFGAPPKFPMPHQLMLLLRAHRLGASKDALHMCGHTLKQMYKGGIFDHIGFGFSRYSTDEKWLAPHFEKMLYDNALLVMAYTECYAVTKDMFYRHVAERTLDYIEREMTSPDGGFYCAQDADIGGEEGKFYTFTRDEVLNILGGNEEFCREYDITPRGNFEGKNILNLIHKKEAVIPDEKTAGMLRKLYDYRSTRFSLHKDDKILTSWNALMLAAFAKTGRIFGEQKYIDRASAALNMINTRMTRENGGLFISYRDGKAKGNGLLDDYAFLAWACLELYEACFDIALLEQAVMLSGKIIAEFSSDSGGFYTSAEDGERLILRTKEQFDGAIPSGNSVAAYCFTRLAALTGMQFWREAAKKQLEFYAGIMKRQPTACTFALLAVMNETYASCEVICVSRSESESDVPRGELGGIFAPQAAIILKTPENAERLAKIAPFTKSYPIPQDHPFVFYICRNGACGSPVHSLEEVRKSICD